MSALDLVNRDTQPVLSIQVSGPIGKGTDHRGRPRFQLPTRWKLQDGTEADYLLATERRKDLPNRLSILNLYVGQGRMRAGHSNGHIDRTVTSIG